MNFAFSESYSICSSALPLVFVYGSSHVGDALVHVGMRGSVQNGAPHHC